MGIVLAQAAIATAEPISVTYTVGIYERCTSGSWGVTCSAYNVTFPLTLTFDTDVTMHFGDASDYSNFYGAPTLSAIPLPRRTDFPPTPNMSSQTAERAHPMDGAWVREAVLRLAERGSQGGSDYYRDVTITANDRYAYPPELSGASFAQFLGTAPFRQFAVGDAAELASGSFESLSYRGNISLDQAVVTPEPASMFLLGTGLVGLVMRRRARRHV